MLTYKNLDIIGTSHIAKESIKELNNYFKEKKPKHVAVELDPLRLDGLIKKRKPSLNPLNILNFGFIGYFFMLIGYFLQQRLGRFVGIQPGSDMLKAVNLARRNKSNIYLIDRDISITLRRLTQEFSLREKFRFIGDFFRAPFVKKEFDFEIDLRKVPKKELIKAVLKYLKRRYPGIYKVLIKERNQIMAKKIIMIRKKFPKEKILIVVGAGHEEGLLNEIKKSKF